MVWAMFEPDGIGDFFPHGDYVGWRERLEAYWREQMPEEEKRRIHADHASRYTYYVSGKFCREIGSRDIYGIELTPLLPREYPTEFRTEKAQRALASLIMLPSGLLVVDEAFKSLIEGLEPSVHQFWPMQITSPKGGNYPNPYYGLLVHRYLDSFRPELSDPKVWDKSKYSDHYNIVGSEKASCAEFIMSDAIIGDAHIWHDRRLRRPHLFISDKLQAEIKKTGLRVWRHYKTKSV
ncbi:MAG: hypothetical protein HC844_02480 [Tabrizicola sp.]|nr:hypothetical protein [Tabrizicola sp.]